MKRLLFAAALTLAGCATIGTPKQGLYAALGAYEAAAASAADYTEGPTADPAIVHRIREAVESPKVQSTVAFSKAYVNCGKPAIARDPTINCTMFNFSDANLRNYAITLRAAIAQMRTK
jgi:hypothetical protein